MIVDGAKITKADLEAIPKEIIPIGIIKRFSEGLMDFHSIHTDVEKAFEQSLNEHISYVQQAGRDMGVSKKQLEVHDLSKWTIDEFPGYAKHFHGGGAPDEFAKAWLHHIHYNPHHWQYWIFPDGYSPKDSDVVNGLVEIPQCYALEMAADWLGASMAYTGSWDMTGWLHNHVPKIRVHSKTAEYLYEVLDSLGYADEIYLEGFRTS